jgi:hypothetical protein
MEQNIDITILKMTLIPSVELNMELWEEARSRFQSESIVLALPI